MSAKYMTVRRFYLTGLWDEEKTRNAVVKGWITEEEFEIITGEPYSGSED